jgi:hypothetical protein
MQHRIVGIATKAYAKQKGRTTMVRISFALLCSVLIVLAGCSVGTSGTQQSPSEMGSTSPSPTGTQSPFSTSLTENPSSTSPVGTASYPHDLRVRNFQENETATLWVRIHTSDGTRIFNSTLTLSPSENRKLDIEYPSAGNYSITTTRQETNYTYQFTIEGTPPSYEIIVSATDEGVVYTKSSP